MPNFNVTLRGPEGFLELGQYSTVSHLKNAHDIAKDILYDLQSDGYIGLHRADGSYSVTRGEAVLSFSVSPVKEETHTALANTKGTFRLRAYCNDGASGKYWDGAVDAFQSRDEAMVSAYQSALEIVHDMGADFGMDGWWFEVERDFEVTPVYANDIVALGTVFPVAVVAYDHAPWDRENDCSIRLYTGYLVKEEYT